MKYITEITRTIEAFVTFTSTDVMSGNNIGSYQVPYTVSAGKRQHKTKEKALKHVNLINAEHGEGTAIYLGKAA
jgi:hypothetical protein